MILLATVLKVDADGLLVYDLSDHRQILVSTADAPRFRHGDLVRIRYSGAMTRSIPPRISALHVAKISSPNC